MAAATPCVGRILGRSSHKTKSNADSRSAEQLPDDELINVTAGALVEEHAVGWMHGRMEFGPRALGNRSILGFALADYAEGPTERAFDRSPPVWYVRTCKSGSIFAASLLYAHLRKEDQSLALRTKYHSNFELD